MSSGQPAMMMLVRAHIRQVSMMNGNVQWDVRARTWTEVRDGVRQGSFLTGVVMDDVVIALEAQ